MSALTIAAAQFAPVADTARNLRTVAASARAAVDAGAALLVTPEYTSFFAAELGQAFVDAAEPVDGPFVTGLREIARSTGIGLVVGTAEQASAERFRNTLVAIGADGDVLAHYRKVHLYDAFGARESDWIDAGDPDQLPVFTLGGVRVGLQTCYDLRFPESTRRLAADGVADVVIVPAEWVRGPGKEHHWRTLLTARAIENTVWVVGVGQTPPVGIGGSVVLDPSGVATAGLGAEPGLLTATVSTEEVDRVRRVNPSLALRRYDVTPR